MHPKQVEYKQTSWKQLSLGKFLESSAQHFVIPFLTYLKLKKFCLSRNFKQLLESLSSQSCE